MLFLNQIGKAILRLGFTIHTHTHDDLQEVIYYRLNIYFMKLEF